MRQFIYLLLGCSFVLAGMGSMKTHAASRYVDIAATGANNGTSWGNAFTNLQSAIAPSTSGDTIFVAQGTYKPDGAAPGNRTLSFNMKTGVVLLGGFPTGGGTLASRNWTTNPTILSGDIGTLGTHTDNSYHVVRCNGQQGELNGFIVERGRADAAAPDNDGGGLFVTSGYVASIFCTFRNNFASDQGGGTYHDSGGNPTYRQCKFESNSAAFGGGSFVFAATFIMSCAYVGNTATSNGGGVYAVVNINMYNSTFKGNSATTSGNAIYYQSGGSNRFFNGIVWGNTGSATHIAGTGSINLRSCIIEGGCPGGGATCTGILNTNPLYADADGRLMNSSPAIDAGDNATGDSNSDGLTIDLDNKNRNFDAIPGGTTRDMGAYESQSLNLSRYYVDHTATGSNNGSSWANAFVDFQSAVAAASSGDTVLVAAGTHKPSVGPARQKRFLLAEGVRYYGGFPNGGGTFAQRDFSANRTILSGDIGTAIDSTDNCFVVVDATNLTPSTLMSGFTVEEGNSDSTGFGHPFNRAGGIHLGVTGSMRLDSVTVRNNFGKAGSGIYAEGPTNWVLRGCTFENNTNAGAVYIGGNATGSMTNCTFTNNVGFAGGAISLNVLTATFSFTNCTFTGNRATASGGGGAINSGQTAGTYTNCTFTNNTAMTGPGGALYKFYSTTNTFTNCTFTGNKAAGGGGALYGQGGFNLYRCVFNGNQVTTSSNHGGAIYNNGTPSIAENCVFWDNRTTIGIGGAIYNNTGGTFTITNSTFNKNNALGFNQGGGINNNSNSNATIKNCIFWGNLANGSDAAANTEIGHGSGTLTVTHTIWQGQTPSGTTYNVDPLFTNAALGDLTLRLCSPAIDTGTAVGAPVVDVVGFSRPFNARPGTLDYDLGAYEFQTSAVDVTPPNAICQNLTLNLNAAGNASTTATAVNNGSTDNCAITSMVLNTTAFTCANVGANTVTLTLSDAAGNTSTCSATVTVQDVTPPTALCQNLTVNLNASGTAALTPAMINNGSSDACGIGNTSVNVTTLTCSNTNVNRLFISDANSVFKSDLNGNNQVDLNPSVTSLYTLAVVPAKDSVYIANYNLGKIQRVHLNGGPVTDIKTGVQPFGIAVDHLAGKIYWADPNANTISRCNMDGSGTQVIVSGTTEADYSRIIKLDLTNGKMYWTDANLGTVKRANLDGTGIQTIVTGQGNIVGLDLDVPANKLYFSSYSFSQIKRANLDGTGLTVIVAATGSVPLGLALDVPAGKIYWVNGSGGNTLKRCDLNGSNQVTLQTGMNAPYDIGLIPAMPVVLTVTDNNTNVSTCTGFVSVQDLIVPTISCPSNVTGTVDPGLCTKVITYTTPVGTDNCPPTTVQTSGLASGAAFPTGVTTNTFLVTDGSGNSATCSFTVTLSDNQMPTIVCPANISTGNGVGTLLAHYPMQNNLTDATGTFGPLTLIGNPTPPAPPTPGNGICHNGIMASFPNGQATQTPNMAALNTTNFTLKVDFKLTGYPGTVAGAPVILGGNSWRWLGLWVSQTGQAGVMWNNSNRLYSSTVLSLNTWYAGEIRYSSNTVQVFIDHVLVLTSVIGPLTTNSNLNFTTSHGGNGTALNGCIQNLQLMNGTIPNCAATVHYSTPVGADNCAGSATVRTTGLASGASFPVGTTMNTFTVTDASGNTATCGFTVTVTDEDLPTLSCPSNITGNNDPGQCSKVVTFTSPVGSDNCAMQSTTQTLGLASGAAFPVGVTTNTFTATDTSGNASSCSFTVSISDNELPVVTCPSNITGNNDPGQCAKVVTYTAPVGSDNCAGSSTALTAGLASGAAFPVGVTTNTFRVTDAAGNTATCAFTVTISDNQAPTISCPSNITGNNDPGLCSKVVTFTAPVGGDNCAGPSTAQTAGLASGAAFPVGVTTNTFRVTDAAGNTATCSFMVTISDNQLPTISCPSNITGNNDPGLCSKVVTYTAPIGGDNCAGQTTAQTAGFGSGTGFPVGTTTNTFRVTDAAGNTATCSFTVTISDNEAPTISCPSNITGNNDPGQCSKVVTYSTPSGMDNCGVLSLGLTSGLGSGAAFPVGVTTNTFQVIDGAGNTGTCSFTVTISDNQVPTISCPSNITGNNDPGLCSKVVTFTAPVGGDNCAGPSTAQTAGLVSGAAYPVGVTVNTFRVTDAAGNTATCSFTVTISDNQVPTISCPSNITGNNDPGLCSKVVTYTAPVGGDNCAGQTTAQTAGLASGAAFPVGVTVNTFRVTDAVGNSATCSFTVTIGDNQLPTISCPSNITGNNDPGQCSKVVTYTAPVGGDNCAGQTTAQTAGLGSGAAFPVGTTTNTFRVTDAAGNSATCAFTVTISDNELPTISCPANITGNNDPGQCSKVVTYTAPFGTDNCAGQATVRTAGLASGAAFPVGMTTNTFRVTDAAGNSATCSFTVTISDNQLPTISCPSNITGNNDPGLCSKVVTFTAPVGGDNCAGQTTGQIAGLGSGAAFPVGTTTNTFRVTDAAGNSATCSFTVTISDNQLPTISCPSNITGNNDPGLCSKVVTYTAPVGGDNCAGQSTTQTAGLGSGAAFPVGTTTNTFRVTDAAGNSATCSFTVTISDNQLPTISCPANITGNNDPGLCSKVVTYSAPVGGDNCAGQSTTQTAGLGSGAAFPVGTTTNTFRVTDAAGNSATCSFTVTISDNELPSISCPSNITGNNDPGLCSKVVTFTAPVGGDNCAGQTTVQIAGLGSGAAFPVGVTTNTFRVTDAAGNSATCSFTVTISDNELPTISCPSNITGNNDPGLCSKVVTFTAPIGGDNCAGQTTTQIAGLASGAAFPIGTTMNTFRVTDAAGNSATCSFTVTISDNELPSISCPSNITGNNDPGLCSKVVTFTAPVGGDNCAGQSTAQTAGLNSGAAFPVGTTTNTFTVTDAAGNSASCAFTVTISDNELPTISCPASITGNNDPGFCSKVVTFTAPVGGDNCTGQTTAQITGFGSGTGFPVGTTTNTFIVTDAAGNSASCAFTVTISDNEAPTISCPANITGNNDPGFCSKVVTYSTPTGMDNCGVLSLGLTAGLGSGSAFPVGMTTNTFEVIDGAGNTGTCSFTVTISDNEAPTISCPSNITGNNDPGQCAAVVTYTAPIGGDNCAGQTTVQSAGLTSGTAFPVGTTTNTFVVTDTSGNTASCTFTVTISDSELPTISCPSTITTSNDLGQCSAVVTFNAPVGADNCAGAATSQTTGLGSGVAFPIGTTTNTFVVTDTSGNAASCTFTVTVNEVEAPVWTGCPGDTTLIADTNTCAAIYSWTLPTASDNCVVDSISATHLPGTGFPVGITTVTYIAIDSAGNSTVCDFTVTVNALPLLVSTNATVAGCYNIACHGDSTGTIQVSVAGGCLPYSYLWSNGATSALVTGLGAGTYTLTVSDGNGSSNVVTTTLTEPAALSAILTGDTVVCAGDSTASIDLIPSGGNDCAAYTYLWNTGATTEDLSGLPDGIYTVTLSDSLGCATTASWIVHSEALPIVDLGPDTLMCPEGGLVLTGDPGYSGYLWSDGATTMSTTLFQTGSYWLQVTTANGCMGSDTILVGEYAVNNNLITANGSLTICEDDSLVLTATSGLTNYLWNTGAVTTSILVVNAGGPHWVRADDNHGCLVSDTTVVNYQPFVGPNPVVTPGPTAFMCEGNPVLLDAGNGYFTYLWSNGLNTQTISTTTPGFYQVTVSNGFGCTKTSAPVLVTEVPNPEPLISFNSGVLTTDNYTSYTWFMDGIRILGAVSQTYVPLQSGWYQVSVVDVNGCQGTSDSLYVNLVGVMDQAGSLNGIDLYPNPTRDVVNVRTLHPIDWNVKIEVWDMFGQLVKTFDMAHLMDVVALDVSDLAAAMYLMKVTTIKGVKTESVVLRFMVE